PPTVRIGFVPVDVYHRAVRLERYPTVKVAPQPAAGFPPPISRLNCVCPFSPAPASLAPQLLAKITVHFHEFSKLRLRDRNPLNSEWPELNGVGPLLINENKWLVRR